MGKSLHRWGSLPSIPNWGSNIENADRKRDTVAPAHDRTQSGFPTCRWLAFSTEKGSWPKSHGRPEKEGIPFKSAVLALEIFHEMDYAFKRVLNCIRTAPSDSPWEGGSSDRRKGEIL